LKKKVFEFLRKPFFNWATLVAPAPPFHFNLINLSIAEE